MQRLQQIGQKVQPKQKNRGKTNLMAHLILGELSERGGNHSSRHLSQRGCNLDSWFVSFEGWISVRRNHCGMSRNIHHLSSEDKKCRMLLVIQRSVICPSCVMSYDGSHCMTEVGHLISEFVLEKNPSSNSARTPSSKIQDSQTYLVWQEGEKRLVLLLKKHRMISHILPNQTNQMLRTS